ncbi:MAG: hypothetical protein RLZZ127_397 [Planctomycetota bacterium]|jgi:hypothetical protein
MGKRMQAFMETLPPGWRQRLVDGSEAGGGSRDGGHSRRGRTSRSFRVTEPAGRCRTGYFLPPPVGAGILLASGHRYAL